MTTLPEDEQAFFFAALAQLPPDTRLVFVERVAATLGAYPHCQLGPGDFNRALRSAWDEVWVPPEGLEVQRPPRWDRATPGFDRISKRAW
jgi:hypothetical protein